MRNLGKEAKTLLLGITIVCVLSLLLAFGVSSVLTKNFQKNRAEVETFGAVFASI